MKKRISFDDDSMLNLENSVESKLYCKVHDQTNENDKIKSIDNEPISNIELNVVFDEHDPRFLLSSSKFSRTVSDDDNQEDDKFKTRSHKSSDRSGISSLRTNTGEVGMVRLSQSAKSKRSHRPNKSYQSTQPSSPYQKSKKSHHDSYLDVLDKESTSTKGDLSSKFGFSKRTSGKQKNTRMLTAGQLSDLFRRLDRDGNGKLSLDEFLELSSKLKWDTHEDTMASVFREVDAMSGGRGYLDTHTFISAYQGIHTRHHSVFDRFRSHAHITESNEFVRAIRYGSDELENYIFEEITGPVDDINLKVTFQRLGECKTYEEYLQHVVEEKLNADGKRFTLDDLNDLIIQDSVRNNVTNGRCKIFWWIDIAMREVETSHMDKYIASFGLPNVKEFRANFGSFGGTLLKDGKSRIFAGNGTVAEGGISSLSFFVQSLWLQQKPVVYHLPEWLDFMSDPRNYYSTRLAFLFTGIFQPSLEEIRRQERFSMLEMAEGMAERLRGEGFDETVYDLSDRHNSMHDGTKADILHRHPIPLKSQSYFRSTEPSWLLNSSTIRSNPPCIRRETLSLHLIHHGFGVTATMTFRKIDLENHNNLPLSQFARCGNLGRLLDGFRRKLFDVICCGGSAIDRGDLVDHPVAIVQHLIGLVHSLSLNVIDSIESWMSVLENEVADIAVSKHFTHLRELRRMQSQVEGYIMPLRDIIIELQEDAVELLMEAENEELQHALDSSSQSLPRQLSSHNLEASFRTTKKISSLYRKSIASVKNQSTLCKTVLLDGVEKQPITFPILEPFLGDRPINFLESILIGDDDLEIKGAVYWGEQIASLEKSLDVIATDCHHSSDEKRNFYSYSLTVVTVFLAPLTILTSYWGMNFDNMTELHPSEGTMLRGVQLLWVVAGVSYSFFFLMALHYRIIYSAT